MIRALATTAVTAALGTRLLHATRNWGATHGEVARVLPGDELVPGPAEQTTLAVTVEAPAEEVWPWLVQIGAGRGGLYSYDRLEDLVGLGIHSADRIHEEWQDRKPGEELTIFPGYATTLGAVDPPHALLIENWGAYVIEAQGADTCRLIARSHAARGLAGLAYVLLIELPHAVMERRMLLGIKRRAEAEPVR